MAHKVICPQKNNIPHFQNKRYINIYYVPLIRYLIYSCPISKSSIFSSERDIKCLCGTWSESPLLLHHIWLVIKPPLPSLPCGKILFLGVYFKDNSRSKGKSHHFISHTSISNDQCTNLQNYCTVHCTESLHTRDADANPDVKKLRYNVKTHTKIWDTYLLQKVT